MQMHLQPQPPLSPPHPHARLPAHPPTKTRRVQGLHQHWHWHSPQWQCLARPQPCLTCSSALAGAAIAPARCVAHTTAVNTSREAGLAIAMLPRLRYLSAWLSDQMERPHMPRRERLHLPGTSSQSSERTQDVDHSLSITRRAKFGLHRKAVQQGRSQPASKPSCT